MGHVRCRGGRSILLALSFLTIDIAPTILDLAAANPLTGIDGRSIVPLFSAGETPAAWRHSFLIEYTTDIVFPRTLKWKPNWTRC